MGVTNRTDPPHTHEHARHDELLVAAHAAGDPAERDAGTVAGWIESCADCRRLATDVAAIRVATAALPAPRRTRDFRLSDDDARRLRQGGWRAVARWFASPRLSFAAPLGSALATLGIVGLLVGTTSFGIGAGGAGATAAYDAGSDIAASAPEVMSAQSAAGPVESPSLRSVESPSASVAAPAADVGVTAMEAPPSDGADAKSAPVAPGGGGTQGEPNPLILASGFLLVVGVLLVTLRIGARRSTAR